MRGRKHPHPLIPSISFLEEHHPLSNKGHTTQCCIRCSSIDSSHSCKNDSGFDINSTAVESVFLIEVIVMDVFWFIFRIAILLTGAYFILYVLYDLLFNILGLRKIFKSFGLHKLKRLPNSKTKELPVNNEVSFDSQEVYDIFVELGGDKKWADRVSNNMYVFIVDRSSIDFNAPTMKFLYSCKDSSISTISWNFNVYRSMAYICSCILLEDIDKYMPDDTRDTATKIKLLSQAIFYQE